MCRPAPRRIQTQEGLAAKLKAAFSVTPHGGMRVAYPQPAGFPVYPPPALDYRATFSRQSLIQSGHSVVEVDFEGHYHPSEALRKVSRALTEMEYQIQLEDLTMYKNPFGTSTGQFIGVVHAAAGTFVKPAGRFSYLWIEGLAAAITFGIFFIALGAIAYLIAQGVFLSAILSILGSVLTSLVVVFREPLFRREFLYGVEVRADLKVALPGETYEDFRKDERVPISTRASAIMASKLEAHVVFDLPKHAQIRAAGKGRDEATPQWLYEDAFWKRKIQENFDSLVRKVGLIKGELL